MPRLIFLGTGYSIPDERHGNTQLAVVAGDRTVLIDSSGDSVVRLEKAGIDPCEVTDLILTHFHPDHVGGVPLLLMDLWLMDRSLPLTVYGLANTLDRVEAMLQLYDWKTWDMLYPVDFQRIPDEESAPVLSSGNLHITSSPTRHFVPSIGIRFDFPEIHASVAYSADTAPCPQMVNLARGADILIHEATEASAGHSSARQAGEIAQAAGVKKLYLIHYPARELDPNELVKEACTAFTGPVVLAEDYAVLDF